MTLTLHLREREEKTIFLTFYRLFPKTRQRDANYTHLFKGHYLFTVLFLEVASTHVLQIILVVKDNKLLSPECRGVLVFSHLLLHDILLLTRTIVLCKQH